MPNLLTMFALFVADQTCSGNSLSSFMEFSQALCCLFSSTQRPSGCVYNLLPSLSPGSLSFLQGFPVVLSPTAVKMGPV